MKSKIILVAAIVMAVITTILFRQYVVNLSNKYKNQQKMINIVVLKTDVKKNQKVTVDMLEMKQFNAASVHPQAVKKIKDIAGDYALTDMKAGEVLFASRFANQYKETSEITRKIRDGYRAVAISVTDVESVSSLIQPEDYVDVVYTVVDKHDSSDVQTEILLQKVRVLAVGKKITESQSNALTGTDKTADKDKTSYEYTSITLELKPDDIVKIATADKKGDIKFVLRSQLTP